MSDPVTGEQAEFSVVDNLHFKIAFDSPNWVLMEQTLTQSLCMRNRFCWFSHPNLKKLHPKYTDPDKVQARADAMGLKDWRDVMHASQNVQLARFELEPFEDVGSHRMRGPLLLRRIQAWRTRGRRAQPLLPRSSTPPATSCPTPTRSS